MKHDWELLELDGGHVGMYSIWKCRGCAATSHHDGDLSRTPELGPSTDSCFLACGCMELANLPADCAASQLAIAEHWNTCRFTGCSTCNQPRDYHPRSVRERMKACAKFVNSGGHYRNDY